MSERDDLFQLAAAGDSEAMRAWGAGLYEDSGGDPAACEFCEKPLDDSEPWQRGLDGAGAHVNCLQVVLNTDEEEGR